MSKANAKQLPQEVLNTRNAKRKAERLKAEKNARAAVAQAKLKGRDK